jgi:hypothetical protein
VQVRNRLLARQVSQQWLQDLDDRGCDPTRDEMYFSPFHAHAARWMPRSIPLNTT